VVEEPRRGVVGLDDARLDPPRGGALAGPRLLVVELEREPPREPLDRLGERKVLGLLDEVVDVAALAAPEAVPQALRGVDLE
jgi:hypothetical protein